MAQSPSRKVVLEARREEYLRRLGCACPVVMDLHNFDSGDEGGLYPELIKLRSENVEEAACLKNPESEDPNKAKTVRFADEKEKKQKKDRKNFKRDRSFFSSSSSERPRSSNQRGNSSHQATQTKFVPCKCQQPSSSNEPPSSSSQSTQTDAATNLDPPLRTSLLPGNPNPFNISPPPASTQDRPANNSDRPASGSDQSDNHSNGPAFSTFSQSSFFEDQDMFERQWISHNSFIMGWYMGLGWLTMQQFRTDEVRQLE